jgi:hypothetical protein
LNDLSEHRMPATRTVLIDTFIDLLVRSLGGIRPSIPLYDTDLHRAYKQRDYTEMVRLIRDTLSLDLRIRVGLVNRTTRDAPAWIEMPGAMPQYGTAEFRETQVTVYIQKSFLRDAGYKQVVMMIAHELSHVVLSSIHHPLQHEEVAVDLTAMLLGFREFYRRGVEYQPILERIVLIVVAIFLRVWISRTRTVGYLTPQEVRYAGQVMDAKLSERNGAFR